MMGSFVFKLWLQTPRYTTSLHIAKKQNIKSMLKLSKIVKNIPSPGAVVAVSYLEFCHSHYGHFQAVSHKLAEYTSINHVCEGFL